MGPLRALAILLVSLGATAACSATASAADPCRMLRGMPDDGHIDTVELVAGADRMGLGEGAKVGLQAGNVMVGGGTLMVRLRAAFDAVDFNGRATCIAVTSLVFSYGEGTPKQGATVSLKRPPAGAAISHVPTPAAPTIFFIDVNEKRAVAGAGEPTIEYVATEGTFSFTRLNAPASDEPDGGDDLRHTVAFDVKLRKVADQAAGTLAAGVETRLVGTFSFETRRPLR